MIYQEIKIECRCGYSWVTTVNSKASITEIKKYFLNKPFNIGTDEEEKIVVPSNVLFKDLDY